MNYSSNNETRVVLDCESAERAKLSLAHLFSCGVDELEIFSQEPVHIEHNEAWMVGLEHSDECLYEAAVKRFGTPRELTDVCWFHCTRVPPDTTFSAGLLPLRARLPALKEMVLAIVKHSEDKALVWKALEEGCEGWNHYFNKSSDSAQGGPHAILVRAVADFPGSLGLHDYLGMPEILTDICDAVGEPVGPQLLQALRDNLRPAVVKFSAPSDADAMRYVAAALGYVRSCLNNGGIPEHSSFCCFNGQNVGVPPSNILQIQFI